MVYLRAPDPLQDFISVPATTNFLHVCYSYLVPVEYLNLCEVGSEESNRIFSFHLVASSSFKDLSCCIAMTLEPYSDLIKSISLGLFPEDLSFLASSNTSPSWEHRRNCFSLVLPCSIINSINPRASPAPFFHPRGTGNLTVDQIK